MRTTIARRAEDLIGAKTRLDANAPIPATELGAETGSWGRVTALRVPALRELAPYNKARGMNEDDLPHLDAICEFFTSAGITPTLEVWAEDANARLDAALTRHGFTPGALSATLHLDLQGWHDPRSIEITSTAFPATVEELGPTEDDADYFATLIGGYEMDRARPEHLAMLRAEHDPGSVRRYLAREGGQPAAAASLYLHPTGALLSGAATLHRFRRHGCQSALIARRLADAAAETDLAVVTVALGSASHINLERFGFRQTHLRTSWHGDGEPRVS